MDGLTSTPVERIFHPKGDIFHALKCSEPSFQCFGEAYFTTVAANATKGWKKHTKMRMNIVVPVGEVKFYIHDESTGDTVQYTIGENNYVRLTIEPNLWVAFKGGGHSLNLVLNLSSIEHDPEEAINMPLERYPLDK